MKFDEHQTIADGGRRAGSQARSTAGGEQGAVGTGRYADADHGMRSRRRTYVQLVGTQFDRSTLR